MLLPPMVMGGVVGVCACGGAVLWLSPVIWKKINPLVKSNNNNSAASPYGERNARKKFCFGVAAVATTSAEAGMTIVSVPGAGTNGCAATGAGCAAVTGGGVIGGGITGGTTAGLTSMCAGNACTSGSK